MNQLTLDNEPLNLAELEAAAKDKMTPMAFDYYASGAWDEITLAENRRAYDRILLRPRMLVDVSNRDLSTTVLGQKIAMPVLIAPAAFQKLAHPDGELATMRAASRSNTIMILSTLANSSIEEVAACAKDNLWFQLYVYKDRQITVDLVRRAEESGCKALVVTVDSPRLGRRERDVRNRFHLPPGLQLKNLIPANLDTLPENTPENIMGSSLAAYIASLYDESLTWKDLAWIAGLSKLPLLVKGILRGDDAVKAVDCGAQGIIISNHGGRQLDGAIASISALAEISEAVDGKAELLVDGGIRRGTDVLKALALGAQAVLVGRPILWGLAADGEAGVCKALGILRDELDLAMALSGCRTIQDITRDLLA